MLQGKVPGVKSIISKASNAKADLFVEPGDKICFGDLFLEVTKICISVYKSHAFIYDIKKEISIRGSTICWLTWMDTEFELIIVALEQTIWKCEC